MEGFITLLHIIICVLLILVILLQSTKGSEMGAVFGGASQTLFGSRGPATFLNKVTAAIAVLFLVTSISLAHMSKNRSVESVLQEKSVIEKINDNSDQGKTDPSTGK